jgi:general secretion pathway protein G
MASRPAINLNWRVAAACAVTAVTVLVASCVIHQPPPKKHTATLHITEFSNALRLFYEDFGRYPTSREGLEALLQNPGIGSWKGPYLNRATIPKDPWNRDYVYRSPGQHGQYDLLSLGEDGREGGVGEGADVTNW